MSISLEPHTVAKRAPTDSERVERSPGVLVACPDARPPAYQAAVGFARQGQLQQFVTAFYYRGHGPISELARRYFPCHFLKWRKRLNRRRNRSIPADRVVSVPSFDVALLVEFRISGKFPRLGRALARWRTRRFDRRVASIVERTRPSLVFMFSDGGSEYTLPTCRRLGIPTILSMVTGDVREERELLETEAKLAPDYFPLYLGGGRLDREAMDWLHERRLSEVKQADLILVPAEHIASELVRHGTSRERIKVVPYAADTRRFRPSDNSRPNGECVFLFAGGIAQRKGIKYLLDAWDRIRRPGLRLQLLGGLPEELGPLACRLDSVEILGRVGHSDVPALMARADVFVFPSLFEGSAVVTYEALACGLPCLVTPQAGSVVRDGLEGFVIEPRDVQGLAQAMARLADDPALRRKMAKAARLRAEQFDWPRYHRSLEEAAAELGVFPNG